MKAINKRDEVIVCFSKEKKWYANSISIKKLFVFVNQGRRLWFKKRKIRRDGKSPPLIISSGHFFSMKKWFNSEEDWKKYEMAPVWERR